MDAVGSVPVIASSTPARCRACNGVGTMGAPGRGWWVVTGLAWAIFLLFGACSALLLPLNLVLVPAWLACASAIGPLARRASEPRCRSCGWSSAD